MAERPLFDPSRTRAARDAGVGASALLSVKQLNELIRGAIARHLPATVHVVGEIGDLSRAASGHLYFTLKDADSEVRCVMWRSASSKLRFTPQVGAELIATGNIEVYLPRGTYQLMVRRLEPRGVGALELAFRQLKEKLEREGLFRPERKRPLPQIPRRVAVVTSPSGAAIRDILQTLARRFPALEVLVMPVRVQGEGAAAEIAQALYDVNRVAASLGGIDVLIVGRGGGSLEDLWAFNEELVARAIAASDIPVVSAVGHEVDVSISDLVADVRAATPTAAAEMIVPQRRDLLAWLSRESQRLDRAVLRDHASAARALTALLARDPLARPLARLQTAAQQTDELWQRVRALLLERAGHARQSLHRAELAISRFGGGAGFRAAGQRVDRLLLAVAVLTQRMCAAGQRRLESRLAELRISGPQALAERWRERLTNEMHRLTRALGASVAQRRALLEARLALLHACDHRRTLQRGYSLTRDARSGRVLKSAGEVRGGQRLHTEFGDGRVSSTADDPRQPGLFD